MANKYTADTFEGAVTGTASGNVAKSGDTMTGDLKIQNSNSKTKAIINNTEGLVPQLEFQQSGTAQWSLGQTSPVESDGRFSISQSGTLGTNEYFSISQTSGMKAKIGGTASANELDDYEEGTANLSFGLAYYYPGATITFSSGQGSGGTGFGGWVNNSKYVKVGSSVTVYIDIKFSNSSAQPTNWLSSSFTTWLGGLPFSVAGLYTSDYNATSPLYGDYSFGINLSTYNSDVGFQIRPYKWGTYGMYFGFTREAVSTTPIYNDDFNYTIGSSNYGVRQITGVIHYRTTQ